MQQQEHIQVPYSVESDLAALTTKAKAVLATTPDLLAYLT